MRKRLSAAAAGVVVAFGFYAGASFLVRAQETSKTPATPMQARSVHLPPDSGKVIDPTPVRLLIPAIGVDAKVEARGLDPDRNLATANDYHDVAWYNLGPRPGDPGNAIVNGHVSWWTGDAVFTRLSNVHVGDVVRVMRADGTDVTFMVTDKKVVDANARIASLFAPSDKATLTLITCSGVWNPLTQSDTQRLLVSASIA